jgi:uncharacterized Zn finger protein (UPF0148 family)
MSAAADSFMKIFGMKRAKSCPDCGSPVEPNGECPECGYGEEEEGEEEGMDVGALLEIRDDLQRIANKIADLIKNGD